MRKVTNKHGSVIQPDRPSDGEKTSAMAWLPFDGDLTKVGMIERAAYWRNVQRACEPYGLLIIARLMENGLIKPEQDPIEAIDTLIELSQPEP